MPYKMAQQYSHRSTLENVTTSNLWPLTTWDADVAAVVPAAAAVLSSLCDVDESESVVVLLVEPSWCFMGTNPLLFSTVNESPLAAAAAAAHVVAVDEAVGVATGVPFVVLGVFYLWVY